jgi:hypothetical protein
VERRGVGKALEHERVVVRRSGQYFAERFIEKHRHRAVVDVLIIIHAEDHVGADLLDHAAQIAEQVFARIRRPLAVRLVVRRGVRFRPPAQRRRHGVWHCIINVYPVVRDAVAIAEEDDILLRHAVERERVDRLVYALLPQPGGVAGRDEHNVHLASGIGELPRHSAQEIEIVVLVRHDGEHALFGKDRFRLRLRRFVRRFRCRGAPRGEERERREDGRARYGKEYDAPPLSREPPPERERRRRGKKQPPERRARQRLLPRGEQQVGENRDLRGKKDALHDPAEDVPQRMLFLQAHPPCRIMPAFRAKHAHTTPRSPRGLPRGFLSSAGKAPRRPARAPRPETHYAPA